MFAFLKEKDIGQEHALAHIAAATYHEFCGAYARADAAYQQGINRLAAPVDRLRAKYAEFQARMARRIARKAAEQGGEATEPEHPERRTLGTLGGRRVGGTRPLGGGLLGGSGKRKADADNSAPADGLDIFVDEEFVGGGPAASAPPNFFNPARTAAGSAWGKLAGFEAGRKENMARPSVWAGQRLKQASAHSAPAAAPLQVFVDEEFSDEALGGVAPSGRGSPDKGLTLRQRLDREDGGGSAPLEEGLLADPLRLHKVGRCTPGLPCGVMWSAVDTIPRQLVSVATTTPPFRRSWRHDHRFLAAGAWHHLQAGWRCQRLSGGERRPWGLTKQRCAALTVRSDCARMCCVLFCQQSVTCTAAAHHAIYRCAVQARS